MPDQITASRISFEVPRGKLTDEIDLGQYGGGLRTEYDCTLDTLEDLEEFMEQEKYEFAGFREVMTDPFEDEWGLFVYKLYY